MARVTVEDCVLKIPNRFNLVMYAAQRARNISAGAEETLQRDNDKNPVVALREIADQTIELDELRENLILGLQKQHPSDDLEDDEEAIEVLAQESSLLGLANIKKDEGAEDSATAADATDAETEKDDSSEADAGDKDAAADEED